MTRPLRIEYPNAWYHVMNRGRRGEEIFCDNEDYGMFLAVLQEATEMFGNRVAAYCLMPNHYHLLVQTPGGNLSRMMRHVNGVYTQRYNRRKSVDGPLFRGRFKSVLVEEDSYLLELIRYIHRNPVRAGLSKTVAQYQWSSHKGYVSSAQKWDWLYKEFPLGMLSGKPGSVIKAYRSFVQNEDSQEITKFFSAKKLATILGSENFLEWVKGKFYDLKKHKEVPESRMLAPTIADIRQAVSHDYGIDPGELDQSRRGQVNEPRNMAVYLCRRLSGLSLEAIGREFGLGNYSSVSSIVRRMEYRQSRNKEMRKRLERIIAQTRKSQDET